MYKVRQKSHPIKIICCFLSNRLEFQCEILVAYVTILFTVKRHLIIFKYDEVIDILADHLAIFFAWCEKVFITYHSCLTLPLSTTAINDRHASHSNGFKPTARNSSEMISGLQIRRSSDSWTTMFGVRCWKPITSSIQVSHRTQRSVAGDLGQPATGPINKAVESFTLRLKTCAKAGGGHFEH